MPTMVVNKVRKPAQEKLSALDVKIFLLKKGISINGLAKKIGRSRTAVSMAIHHGFNAGTLAKVVAELKELKK